MKGIVYFGLDSDRDGKTNNLVTNPDSKRTVALSTLEIIRRSRNLKMKTKTVLI